MLERDQDALEAFNKSTELDPDNSDAWRAKGLSLGKLRKNEEALIVLNKADVGCQ
jgi:Flp pilus assembly protein TadD